jgi:hypothetical protein
VILMYNRIHTSDTPSPVVNLNNNSDAHHRPLFVSAYPRFCAEVS